MAINTPKLTQTISEAQRVERAVEEMTLRFAELALTCENINTMLGLIAQSSNSTFASSPKSS